MGGREVSIYLYVVIMYLMMPGYQSPSSCLAKHLPPVCDKLHTHTHTHTHQVILSMSVPPLLLAGTSLPIVRLTEWSELRELSHMTMRIFAIFL